MTHISLSESWYLTLAIYREGPGNYLYEIAIKIDQLDRRLNEVTRWLEILNFLGLTDNSIVCNILFIKVYLGIKFGFSVRIAHN